MNLSLHRLHEALSRTQKPKIQITIAFKQPNLCLERGGTSRKKEGDEKGRRTDDREHYKHVRKHNETPHFIQLTSSNEIKGETWKGGSYVHHGPVTKPVGYTACPSWARSRHHPIQTTQLSIVVAQVHCKRFVDAGKETNISQTGNVWAHGLSCMSPETEQSFHIEGWLCMNMCYQGSQSFDP